MRPLKEKISISIDSDLLENFGKKRMKTAVPCLSILT